MASGVKVNDDCKGVFESVKMKSKKVKKIPYAVFKVNDSNTEIVEDEAFHVHDSGEDECKGLSFSELIQALPKEDGRYVVYDYPFVTEDGAPASKLLMVLWCPVGMAIKKKMVYASSKDALKKIMSGDIPEFQCDGPDDLCCKEVEEKLRKLRK